MTKEIQLTRGQIALVSDHRFEELNKFTWCALHDGWHWYAARSEHKTLVMMHRQIMGVTEHSKVVDHKDGNGLNNQDENLRVCNRSQNQSNRVLSKNNTSGYKGVCLEKRSGLYVAQLKFNKKMVYRERFSNPLTAAYAYDNAARKYYGEFAGLNFPNEQRDIVPEPKRQKWDGIWKIIRGLVEYRDGTESLNFQLEKADEYINQLRAAMERHQKRLSPVTPEEHNATY